MNLFALALSVALAAKPGTLPKVAVADLADATGQDAGRTKILSQLMVSEVSQMKRFTVIDSAGIAQVVGLERQRQLMGCNESGCLAELGGAMGVDYILAGSLGRLGKKYRIDLKLVDAKRGVTLASAGEFIDGGDDELGTETAHAIHTLFEQAKLVEAAPAPASDAFALQPSPPPKAESSHVPAYLLMGGGVALGVVAGLISVKASNDYQHLQELSTGADANAFSSQQGTVRADDLAADALFAGAAVAAGAGIYFLFTPSTGDEKGAEVGVGGHF